MKTSRKCRGRAFAVAALLLLPTVSMAGGGDRPAAADLARWQTPVKNQWGRGNCFIHATVAAMEAAYKRAGGGDLDLSELFSDYMGQLFFLETVQMDGHWYTTTMRVPAATERETSIQSDHAMSVESGMPGMVLALPEEKYFPYIPRPHDLGGHADKNDPFWANQYTVSSFNLDPENLPFSALSAPRYYRIRSVEWLPKEEAKNPAALEAVLAGGHEILWDFRWAGDLSGPVWKYAGPPGDAIPHRMLLIGYDRTDPQNPYFLAKNSWGDIGVFSTNDCLTRLEYDYLEYGEWASYISAIEPPRPWPELQILGRWRLEFGAHAGILDLYHLPGMMQKDFDHNQFLDETGRPVQDRRLGCFYRHGDPAQACRVNGTVRGHDLALYLDFEHPAARWDRLRGWKLEFTLDPRRPHRLEGRATAPDGRRTTARAERNLAPISPVPPAAAPPSAPAPEPAAAEDAQRLEELRRKLAEEEQLRAEEGAARRREEEIRKLAAIKTAENEAAADAPVFAKWRETGGDTGFLGAAQTVESVCPDGRGHYVHFAGGSIYWTPETGAHVIYGAIREKWAALGWETCAFLGYPLTDETGTPDGVGRFNHFERGSIYWTPATGACEIHGPIRDAWERQGRETGPLGYPVSDVTPAADKTGVFSAFQHGTIRWSPVDGARPEMYPAPRTGEPPAPAP